MNAQSFTLLILFGWAEAIISWAVFIAGQRPRAWSFIYFSCAVIATLAILLARAWWGWP